MLFRSSDSKKKNQKEDKEGRKKPTLTTCGDVITGDDQAMEVREDSVKQFHMPPFTDLVACELQEPK